MRRRFAQARFISGSCPTADFDVGEENGNGVRNSRQSSAPGGWSAAGIAQVSMRRSSMRVKLRRSSVSRASNASHQARTVSVSVSKNRISSTKRSPLPRRSLRQSRSGTWKTIGPQATWPVTVLMSASNTESGCSRCAGTMRMFNSVSVSLTQRRAAMRPCRLSISCCSITADTRVPPVARCRCVAGTHRCRICGMSQNGSWSKMMTSPVTGER